VAGLDRLCDRLRGVLLEQLVQVVRVDVLFVGLYLLLVLLLELLELLAQLAELAELLALPADQLVLVLERLQRPLDRPVPFDQVAILDPYGVGLFGVRGRFRLLGGCGIVRCCGKLAGIRVACAAGRLYSGIEDVFGGGVGRGCLLWSPLLTALCRLRECLGDDLLVPCERKLIGQLNTPPRVGLHEFL
jgi:hypothetical protein